jgi:hypothetical protein
VGARCTEHGVPWLKPGLGRAHVLSFFSVVAGQLSIFKFEVKGLLEGDQQSWVDRDRSEG